MRHASVLSCRGRARALALVSGALCVTLLAGACSFLPGHDGPAGNGAAGRTLSGARALALAAKSSRHIKSFTIAGTMTFLGLPASSGFSHLTVHLRERLELSPSVLADITISMRAKGKHIALEEILTAGAAYVRLPRQAAPPGTKPWLRLILPSRMRSQLHRVVRQMMNGGPLGPAGSPRAHVRLLKHARHFHVVRGQRVAGVATTEYAGTLPPRPVSALVPAGQLPAPRAAAGMRVSGPVKVWFDGQHVARRVRLRIIAQQMVMSLMSTVTSVNKPVRITLPPASQVSTRPIGPGGLGQLAAGLSAV